MAAILMVFLSVKVQTLARCANSVMFDTQPYCWHSDILVGLGSQSMCGRRGNWLTRLDGYSMCMYICICLHTRLHSLCGLSSTQSGAKERMGGVETWCRSGSVTVGQYRTCLTRTSQRAGLDGVRERVCEYVHTRMQTPEESFALDHATGS